MGSLASKAGRVAGAAGKALPKAKPPAARVPDSDPLATFKPTKVVTHKAATLEQHQAAVPGMDASVLEQLVRAGPVVKSEVTDQVITAAPGEEQAGAPAPPGDAALKVTGSVAVQGQGGGRRQQGLRRPLPTNRSRLPVSSDEVEKERGLLTQTQALELLEARDPADRDAWSLARRFDLEEPDTAALLTHCRTPEVRTNSKEEQEARWDWEGRDLPR